MLGPAAERAIPYPARPDEDSPQRSGLRALHKIAAEAHKQQPATLEEKQRLAAMTREILSTYKIYDAAKDMSRDKLAHLKKHLPRADEQDIFFVQGDIDEALSHNNERGALKILAKAIVKWGEK